MRLARRRESLDLRPPLAKGNGLSATTRSRSRHTLRQLSLPACILAGGLALISWKVVSVQDGELSRAVTRLDRVVLGTSGGDSIAPCSDEDFVRRAYLEIVGRIPTVKECSALLTSNEKGKRSELIDDLLSSPGHMSSTFHFWVDLLRVKSKLSPRISGAPYLHWIKSSISSRKPFDEMVRELLTSEGSAYAPGNGATGYYLRDLDMLEDNMAATVSAFLGTRIECAQCHDHPYDEWTRRQFFEMRAFTGGMEYLGTTECLPNSDLVEDLLQEFSEAEDKYPLRAMRELFHNSMVGVFGSGTGLVQLPNDYQYDDGNPGAWVPASSLFGEEASTGVSIPASAQHPNAQVNSRVMFADWLTSPENPAFARSIANRLWKRLFGEDLNEPSTGRDDEHRGSNPALLDELERLMLEVEFDLDEFLRVVYRTKAWQAQAVSNGVGSERSVGPPVRRMSAEQVWDSLMTLIVDDLDSTIDPTGAELVEREYGYYEDVTSDSEAHLRARVADILQLLTGRDERRKFYTEKRRERAEARRIALEENEELYRQLEQARRSGDAQTKERVLENLRALGIGPFKTGLEWELVRASELESPAPEGHLLREFGQSDHEQINGASRKVNVPQAMALLNGTVEKWLMQNPDARLSRELAEQDSPESKIQTAFIGVLSRMPTTSEVGVWISDFRSDSNQASQDLVWTLLNSHEFVFIR